MSEERAPDIAPISDSVRAAYEIFGRIPHWQVVKTFGGRWTIALCRRTSKTPFWETGVHRMAPDCNPFSRWWMVTLPWTRFTVTRWYT